MNIERLEALAARIEAMPHVDAQSPEEHGFNMRFYRNEYKCGTACCISGVAAEMMGDEFAWSDETATWLGLSDEYLSSLYFPHDSEIGCDQLRELIPPQHAAAVIRNLIKTGEVDWSVGAK